jgi:tetratricopeptide (TPR) repeat protein
MIYMQAQRIFYSLLLGTIILLSACKQDNKDVFFTNHPQLETLKNAYDEAPDATKANELLRALHSVLGSGVIEDGQMISFLEYGYEVATDQNMTSRRANFLFPLIKEDFENSNNADRIFELYGIMKKMKKDNVAIVLGHGLKRAYPSYDKLSEIDISLPEGIENIDAYIMDLGTRIFDNPDKTGINRASSLKYVDACEAYALVFPKSESTPEYLFKAAEVAKSLRTFPKSLSLYDWIIDGYPAYEKTATALFLKGFIIENNLGDEEKAREVYNEFLQKYPDHELADDIAFLIENLGKSDEEILELIEQRSQQAKQEELQ